MALLQLESVTKAFPGARDGAGTAVLAGVELVVEEGEALAVVGPSGCGKSTLLNLIGGLDRPSRGSVRLAGEDLAALDARALARVRNRELGYVFQAHHLLPQCTALENVLVPTLVSDDQELRRGAEERARGLLQRVGLGARLDHRPSQLSGGEAQRVAVVRALINGPRLVLADEPTGSLDAAAARNLSELLLELNGEQGTALLVVTHSDDLAGCFERVLTLDGGHLRATAARA